MSKKNAVFLFVLILLILGAVLMFALAAPERGEDPVASHDGDPLRERGMRAAAIGGELAAVVQGQLDALPDEHREEVGELLGGLEERVAAVKEILSRRDASEESLAEAVASLEALLEGILVVPNNETVQQEGSANS